MPQSATFSSQSYDPDRLIAGPSDELISRNITLLLGQNLTRGAVIGKITLGALASAIKGGGNTGNGTCVVDAVAPLQAGAQLGVYQARVTAAGANTATFRVTDPKGNVLGDATFNGAGASFTWTNQIKFAITDGAVDFIVGDGFDLTVAAGSGKYVLSLAAALDGSAVPDAILVDDTDATAADKVTLGYTGGQFNSARVTLGAGQTVAGVKDLLRQKGIILIDPIGA